MTTGRKARGRPALPAEQVKRHSVGIRTTRKLKDYLLRAANLSGRSLAQEVEYRLERSLDRRTPLDEAFELAFGQRAGLVRFLGEIVRGGGGSQALICAMQRLAVPDLTNDPEGLANRLIWDAGYSDSQVDADRAAEGARWRERLGPELGGLLVAANRRLRAERESEPQPDPGGLAAFARATRRE